MVDRRDGALRGTPFDVLHTIGTSVLTLGLAVLAWDAVQRAHQQPDHTTTRALSLLPHGLLSAFACAGSMSLTLYSAHVVVTDTLQQDLAAKAGAMRHIGFLAYATQVAVALLVAVLWRWYLPRGPLEQMVHSTSFAAARLVRRTPAGADQRHGSGQWYRWMAVRAAARARRRSPAAS